MISFIITILIISGLTFIIKGLYSDKKNFKAVIFNGFFIILGLLDILAAIITYKNTL